MNLSLWVLDTTWHSEIVSPHKPPSDSQCILAPVDAIVITMSSNQFNIWYCPCWYDELWLHPASWPVGNIDLTSVPCFFLIISQVYSWQTPSKHTLSSLWVSLHISRCVVITGSRCGWKSIAPCSVPITVFVKGKHIISKGAQKESVSFIFMEIHSHYRLPVILSGIKTI